VVVGTYILPTALLKHDGRVYSCAAFNVPERLAFGNLWDQPLRDILAAANRDAYVQTVRGGGLKALHGHVPPEFTGGTECDSFCGSCKLLIGEFDRARGAAPPVLIPAETLAARQGPR
jgi:Iron-sulfur cluster-binding domain